MRLDEDTWLSIAQYLSPGDVFSLGLSSKCPFFAAYFDKSAHPKAHPPLVQRMLKVAVTRELDARLHEREPALSLRGLFPNGGDDLDEQGRPQVILSCALPPQRHCPP